MLNYNNMRLLKTISLFLLLFTPTVIMAQKGNSGHTITFNVTDKDTKESIIMATVQLQPTGAMTVTDANGKAVIRNVQSGNYQVSISYVGYEPINTHIKVNGNMKMDFKMATTTLALREVNVVARQKAGGASTTSVIGRQAIDHLQASSLADIMQLIPGQLMTNTDLTAQSNLQIRTLSNNNTAAFGSGVIVYARFEQRQCAGWKFLGNGIHRHRPA